MDKYEFNIKAEQIRKMVDQGDFKTAMQIADTIDWRRVRNANLLASVADIYEENKEYEEAKDILLLAFERAPVGKRFLFKLSEISVKAGEIPEAQEFYREFCEMSPDDSRQYLLRYMILKAKGAAPNQLINCLEQYTSTDVDEAWLYELARLYSEAGREDDCVKTCDKIMLLFGLGKYVDKAMELKLKYQPLSKAQMDLVENRDKYEEKLKMVSEEYSGNTAESDYDESGEDGSTGEDASAAAQGEEQAKTSVAPENTTSASNAGDQAEKAAVQTEKEVAAAKTAAAEKTATIREDTVPETAEQSAAEKAAEQPEIRNYHMIIEAMTREDGFRIAVDEIKYFHEKYGVDYKVAKTDAEKLNEKGFSVFVPKLKDKDLIIENAGSLTYAVVDEISDYLDHLRESCSVVLVDVMDRFDRMSEDRPLFLKKFDIVSDVEEEDDGLLEDVDLEHSEEARPAETEPQREEPVPVKQPEPEIRPARPYNAVNQAAPAVSGTVPSPAADLRQQEPAEETAVPQAPVREERKPVRADYAAEEVYEDTDRPVRGPENTEEDVQQAPDESDLPADYYNEMSIDDFATYAQEYAKSIDCVMPGKTVLALYERIELMQEDNIALNKASAEQLIEDAADKAEKPGLGKKLGGMFHPKYDKDDRLILREENFIN